MISERLKLAFILGIALSLFSCILEKEKTTKLKFISNTALLEKVSYQLINQRIFSPKCISCHGDSGGINLESYNSILLHLDKINQSAIIDQTMPKSPYSKLTKQDLILLSTWIKAGAPETAEDGSTPPPIKIEPLKPTFKSIQKNILQKKCMVCHSSGKEAERVNLNSPEEMIESPYGIIVPEVPDESGLVLVTLPTARKRMPPPKSGLTALRPEEIEVLKEWITNGAKD